MLGCLLSRGRSQRHALKLTGSYWMKSSQTSNRPVHTSEPVTNHSTAQFQITSCFTFVAMHKLRGKKSFTHSRFVRVWVTLTPFPQLDYWDLLQGLNGNRCKLTKLMRQALQSYIKRKMFRRPSAEHKQSRKEKQGGPGRLSQRMKTRTKMRSKWLHAAPGLMHVCRGLQRPDWFFFFERSIIYSPWKPKSLALTLSCDGESFGWWKSK